MTITTFAGTLKLTVSDAKDLKASYGKTDPYCKVSLGSAGLGGVLHGQGIGKERFKTKPHESGGTNPVWNESHVFDLKGMKPDVKLKIALYDQDTFKDDYLGLVELTLGELLKYDAGKQQGIGEQGVGHQGVGQSGVGQGGIGSVGHQGIDQGVGHQGGVSQQVGQQGGKYYFDIVKKGGAVVGKLGILVQFDCTQFPDSIPHEGKALNIHQPIGAPTTTGEKIEHTKDKAIEKMQQKGERMKEPEHQQGQVHEGRHQTVGGPKTTGEKIEHTKDKAIDKLQQKGERMKEPVNQQGVYNPDTAQRQGIVDHDQSVGQPHRVGLDLTQQGVGNQHLDKDVGVGQQGHLDKGLGQGVGQQHLDKGLGQQGVGKGVGQQHLGQHVDKGISQGVGQQDVGQQRQVHGSGPTV